MPSSSSTTISSLVTLTTSPAGSATTTWPESTAAWRSMPVPTIGASGRSSGTAWRCMLEPINARLASSCSRNGISAAETETICLGDTSMYSILPGVSNRNCWLRRTEMRDSVKWPCSSSARVRLRDGVAIFLVGRQEADLVGHFRRRCALRASRRSAARSARPALRRPRCRSCANHRAVGQVDHARAGSCPPAASGRFGTRLSTLRYGVSMKPNSLILP